MVGVLAQPSQGHQVKSLLQVRIDDVLERTRAHIERIKAVSATLELETKRVNAEITRLRAEFKNYNPK